MRKYFIVENVEANFNKITCLSEEIKEGINFRLLNAKGVWHTEGKSDDALEVDYGITSSAISVCPLLG